MITDFIDCTRTRISKKSNIFSTRFWCRLPPAVSGSRHHVVIRAGFGLDACQKRAALSLEEDAEVTPVDWEKFRVKRTSKKSWTKMEEVFFPALITIGFWRPTTIHTLPWIQCGDFWSRKTRRCLYTLAMQGATPPPPAVLMSQVIKRNHIDWAGEENYLNLASYILKGEDCTLFGSLALEDDLEVGEAELGRCSIIFYVCTSAF